VPRRYTIRLLVLAAVAPVLGWTISDRLESENWFCVSCHLDSGAPLHGEKFKEFTSEPVESLVAAHFAPSRDFRCIDCHRGTSWLGRVRVKAVAAGDAARYFLSSFGEPERMRYPLWDEDCVQCHASYESTSDDAYHAIASHDGIDQACVDCHQAHPTSGNPDLQFLSREVVLPVCQNCHEEY
jgi:hypothetical protein